MRSLRDPNAVISAWLDEGPTELPERNRRAIVTAARTITQRRRGFGSPWRDPFMNGFTRLALAAAAVVAVALGGIYLVNPGPGGSIGAPGPSATPTLTPTPTASPRPTPRPANAGTITLTDDGCTWDGNPSPLTLPKYVGIDFVNETNTFGNFGFYKLEQGYPWADAVAYIVAENEAVKTGTENPFGAADFAIDYGNVDTEAFKENQLRITVSRGTYGVVCSSNEPPPGAVFDVYLVGPLVIE